MGVEVSRSTETKAKEPGAEGNCGSYVAEGVRPVPGGVDVAGRGGAVALCGRGVRDDGGLA